MEMLGYSREEYVGQHISKFHANAKELDEIIQRLERGERLRDYPATMRCRDGTIRNVLIDSCVLNQDGKFVHTQCFTRDVTEQLRMEESLRRTEGEMRNYAEMLEQTVGERTSELRDTIAALEAFSFSISHDLRAPLRSMKGFAAILLEDHAQHLVPEPRELARRIHLASEKMARLIDEVLAYNRLMSGDLAAGRVDLEGLVSEILETYPHLQQPQTSIHVLKPLPQVRGDAAALKQCMLNLIGNAVKFVHSGTNPRVVIRAELQERMVRLWVEDNGIGIESADREKIFQMHQRLSARYEGHGIGLALVRRAVEKMGGRVGVESDPGKGSRFWLELIKA
jgi:PAS domain S-box-containing protein